MTKRLFELIRRGWRKPPHVIVRWLARQAGAELDQRMAPSRVRWLDGDRLLGLLGEENLDKLVYYPTTTREESAKMGRITYLIENGELFSDLGVPALDPATDRAMVCGSLGFNLDIKALLEQAGLREGANSDPAEFVIEKAFVG